jgi:hypothetical protein
MKKPYTKPAILVRVKCEARAVQCAKSSEAWSHHQLTEIVAVRTQESPTQGWGTAISSNSEMA